MARVGAEYGRGETVRWTARHAFLGQVEKVAPEVVEVLRELVLPPYRTAWEKAGGFPSREFWELEPSFFSRDIAALAAEHPEAAYGQLVPLANALHDWSDRFKLVDEWCLKVALHTLNEWTRWPNLLDREPGRFRLPSYGEAVPEGPPPPEFRLPDWDPTLETWAAYETRARSRFDAALRDYRDAARGWADALGLERAPTKNAPRGLDLTAHFTWLVRFQCQGWGHQRLAEEYDRLYSTGAVSPGRRTVRSDGRSSTSPACTNVMGCPWAARTCFARCGAVNPVDEVILGVGFLSTK